MSGEASSLMQDRTARKRPRRCAVPSCNGKHYAKSYCNKHYWRMFRNGHLDPMPSGKASPNYGKNKAAIMEVA